MAVTDSSKVIIEVDLLAEDANEQANLLGVSLQKLKDRQKELRAEGKLTSAEYVKNAQSIRTLTAEQKAYINIANQAKGSNNSLRAQLSLLTTQYNALSKEERENTTAGKALTIQTRAISDELKKNEDAVGDNRRSVGDYTKSINQSIVSQIPFGNQIQNLTVAFSAFKGVVTDLKAAQDAQRTATELNTAAIESQTAAEAAERQSTVAAINALELKTRAEAEAVQVAEIRAEADRQRLIIENQLIATEERAAAVEAQLIVEQQAIVAEERLRITAEEALLASQLELVAAEEARIAVETELIAAQAAAAASAEVGAARQTAAANATKIAGATIAVVILAIGAAALSAAKQLDTFADNVENEIDRNVRGWREFGGAVVDAVSGKGWAAFDGLKKRIGDAADEGARFSQVFQGLGDLSEINDLSDQQTQNEVQNLRIQARNRALGNDQKERLLAEADRIERNQFVKTQSLHNTIIAESVAFAQTSVKITEKFTDDERKALESGNLQIANNLLNAGRITRDAYTRLKDAYTLRNSDIAAANNQLEKIENDRDKFAEQQKAKDEKRIAEEKAANEELIRSRLTTASLLLTARQKEVADINNDIDKRIRTYQKYGQVTTQLEIERTERLKAIAEKYYEDDIKIIEGAYNKSVDARLAALQNGIFKEEEQRRVKNERELADIDKQILDVTARLAKGEEDKNGVLDTLFAERKAVTDRQESDEFEATLKLINDENAARDAQRDKQIEDAQIAFDAEYQIAQERMQINSELLNNYEGLFGGIAGLLGQNTTAGKIALGLQKAFAIAEIIIQGEKERAAVNYAAAAQAAFYAPLGPFGIAAAAGIYAAAAAKNVEITTREVISSGIIAAQTIASIIGKEKGGIQYSSDGLGAQLPGYSKKDNMNARLRSGETVIVSEASRDPNTKQLLSDINVAYGGRAFANGGVYPGSNFQATSNSITQQIFDRNQLYQSIKQIKIYTAIDEVRSADAKYTDIVEAGNF